jgi:probable rRNA maturation factor
MINLHVKRNVKLPVDKEVLFQTAQLTLDMENIIREYSLSIVIGNDRLLKKLNQKYRNIDTPTEVLSFPANELDPESNLIYLGDVIISLPRAEYQATLGGHPLVNELQLLVVHGILHLLGYDHSEEAEKKIMQTAQNKVLIKLGIKLDTIL